MHDCRARLGLGTVQFGLDYGISNEEGMTPQSEVRAILDECTKQGITLLDTARGYGKSEEALGNADASHIKIITKIFPIKKPVITDEDRQAARRSFQTSLYALKKNKLYGILLHHAEDALVKGGARLIEDLQGLKNEGKVSKIGISVYEQSEIERSLNLFEFDLIQIPANIFDQRLIQSSILKDLKKRGIEIHVRSAFLQGVVFMKSDELPHYLEGLRKPLKDFTTTCDGLKTTPAAAALAFLMAQPEIDRVICGVNTRKQLSELCEMAANLPTLPKDYFDKIAVSQAHLINPSLWGKKE